MHIIGKKQLTLKYKKNCYKVLNIQRKQLSILILQLKTHQSEITNNNLLVIYQIYNIYNIHVYRIKTNNNIQLNITNVHSCFKLALYAKCKYSKIQSKYVSITHSTSCSAKYIYQYSLVYKSTYVPRGIPASGSCLVI